ncbi:MAG TPA: alpha/beta fold hydrolase [Terriglobales bacterium]|nr:alpha/beta fold hydrolase [Terriglobales bacterium]
MLTERRQPDIPEWLRDLYPFHTRDLDVGQYRMSLVDEGASDAPVLLLLHGNPTWSFIFRDLIRQASQRFHIIAPDHIGFGLSDKPLDPTYHTLVRHTENLSTLIATLGLRNITLVTHGWGGPIGLGYATAHPENISRLVLCNTWALPVTRTKTIKIPFKMRLAKSGRIGRYLDSVLNLTITASISSRSHRTPSDWALEAYTYPFPNMKSRAAIQAFTRMFLDPSDGAHATMAAIYEGLKNVSAPADILFGAHDPILSKLPAYLLRDSLRNSREPVFFEHASHLLPEDAPEALANVVLREQPSAASSATMFKILS